MAATLTTRVMEWAKDHPGTLLLGSVGLYLAWRTFKPVYRWRIRCIPGPMGLPLLGNLVGVVSSGDVYEFVAINSAIYKKAWQMWIGVKPHVVVSDMDLARRAATRFTARPDMDDLTIRHGEDRVAWNSQLIFLLSGKEWRVARKAFESAVLHPKSLMAQAPFVAQCADRLCARLQRYADSGEPVDVLPLVYAMTLDAVGFAAFGLDMGATGSLGPRTSDPGVDVVATLQLPFPAGSKASPSPSPRTSTPGTASSAGALPPEGWWKAHPLGSAEFGRYMVECAVGVMKSMSLEASSAWSLVPLFFPWAEGLVRVVSRWLPDKPMVAEKTHFRGLKEACKVIIQTWRDQQASSGAAKTSVISEQGFLARLLSDMASRAPGTEEDHMNDLQLVGNAIGLVVTGYETTGSSIASTLHYLARSPEVQERLQQEVDQVVGGKAVSPEDLERMPYLNAVLTESLRLKPPGNALVRHVADSDFDLGDGMSVPKGTYLFLPSGYWMVNPTIWPRAREFLPERHLQPGHEELAPSNPAAMMPFGAGQRMCVGYRFAQLEARMGVARLMQRFTFSPVPGHPEPKWVTALAYSPDQVTLHVTRRDL